MDIKQDAKTQQKVKSALNAGLNGKHLYIGCIFDKGIQVVTNSDQLSDIEQLAAAALLQQALDVGIKETLERMYSGNE